jgi:hypothetical protein
LEMRLGSIVLAFVAGAGPAMAQDAGPAFAFALPEGVGDVAAWETVSGEFETETMRGAYRFYVNPVRAAMYQVMRYRVELVGAAGVSARARGSAERVAFVRRPGAREPLACWERQAPGVTPAWRRIGAETEEYRREMTVLMQVLAVHRMARETQSSP